MPNDCSNARRDELERHRNDIPIQMGTRDVNGVPTVWEMWRIVPCNPPPPPPSPPAASFPNAPPPPTCNWVLVNRQTSGVDPNCNHCAGTGSNAGAGDLPHPDNCLAPGPSPRLLATGGNQSRRLRLNPSIRTIRIIASTAC